MANQKKLERQIERLERRLERAGALQRSRQESEIVKVGTQILMRYKGDLDLDDDGEIQAEELAKGVVDLVNTLLPLPGIAKIATEWTAKELVEAVVMFVDNRRSRLEKRLAKKQARLD